MLALLQTALDFFIGFELIVITLLSAAFIDEKWMKKMLPEEECNKL